MIRLTEAGLQPPGFAVLTLQVLHNRAANFAAKLSPKLPTKLPLRAAHWRLVVTKSQNDLTDYFVTY